MGVHLRGGNVGMTKQQLYYTQISAVIDEVRGKCVTQGVGRDAGGVDTR